ncbi:MAG TPA: rhomboid family intramembrane serine protease [Candidatus Mediterraneibacter avicola]|nr:rhomboid family intramembrane serine protease [Candidatus Mediterraneibacter avicola]
MNWLDKLERKLGRFAIPNLTVYLMICYVIGFMLWNLAAMNLIPAEVIGYLTLEPALILRGQVWRLITWLVVPPSSNLISLVFFVLLYYSLGTALERTWGVFRYNVYIFSGLLFTVLAVFGLYAFYYFAYGFEMPMSVLGMAGSNYVTLSIFLAFAAIYPEMEVLLYFILPIKMKWMALVYVAIAGYDFINGNIVTRVVIGTSLLNFVIFFLSSRNFKRFGPGEQARKAKFKKQSRPHMTYTNGAHHRCAVCGRTELDDPCLEFRYCSKCNGNYEYCQDHLFTHEHVK